VTDLLSEAGRQHSASTRSEAAKGTIDRTAVRAKARSSGAARQPSERLRLTEIEEQAWEDAARLNPLGCKLVLLDGTVVDWQVRP
jgi:hypothetical protein